jgi:hypothetical protein
MAGRIAYLGNIVTRGLILELDAAKPESFNLTGSTFNDLSGRQNNSQLVQASFTTGSGPETAISFTTGSMYLACLSSNTTTSHNQFLWDPSGSLGNSAITVDVWFKSDQTVFPNSYLISKPWNGSGEYNYWIRPLTTSSFTLHCRLASGTYQTNITNVPIIDGTWKNVVLWISPTQVGYYVNGTQYSGSFTHGISGSIPTFGNANLALAIMTLYPYPGAANPSFSITGSLSNVKFYNRQLSQAEVLQNFNAYRSRYGI